MVTLQPSTFPFEWFRRYHHHTVAVWIRMLTLVDLFFAVKFTIKSFTVPELSVDLPESATVSSLKRAVMDAAMNLLGGGLRVRVLMQGKKVPDEGATLAQVGISLAGKPDTLGFMLEPSPVPTSPTATSEDPLLVLSRAAGQTSPR
jgi:hypothetical protein